MTNIGTRIGTIFGAFTMGIIFNVLLYGVVTQQYHMYLLIHRNDKLWLRLYVSYLFIADTLHTGFLIGLLYQSLITHNGQIERLGQPLWILAAVPVIAGFVAFTVQIVYAARIRQIFGYTLVPAIIILLSFTSGAASVWNAVILFIPNRPTFTAALSTWLITGTVADILIAFIMLWHLYKRRNVPDSANVVQRVGRVIIQTNLITTICAFLDTVVFLASPNAAHTLFNFPLSKFYTISILSSLNSRGIWARPHKPLSRTPEQTYLGARSSQVPQTQFSTQIMISDSLQSTTSQDAPAEDVEMSDLRTRRCSTSSSATCNSDQSYSLTGMWTIDELEDVVGFV